MKLIKEGNRWLVVAGYAVAMAWVEAAVVFYLRMMVGRLEPYQPNPLPIIGALGPVELVRELATMLMLFTVGALAGRSWRARLGYTAMAFGMWDIFYYVFLKLMCGWPHSLLNWDILFLIPLPWWGPVLAPVIIALLMIAWGTLASQCDHEGGGIRREWKPWVLSFMGVTLALYLFMADSLMVANHGVQVIRQVLPRDFAWGWFALAAGLMSAPVLELAWKILRPRVSPARPATRENPESDLMRTEIDL